MYEAENNPTSQKRINPLLVVFLITQIIIIALLAISLPKLFQDPMISGNDFAAQSKITIEGLRNTFPSLKQEDADIIEWALLGVVKESFPDVSLSESRANMRNVEEITFDYQQITHISFLADIPDLQLSYRVFYDYSPINNNPYMTPNDSIIVLCAQGETEVIYSNSNCRDIYGQITRNSIAAHYLTYLNSSDFSAYIFDDDLTTVIIYVDAESIDTSREQEVVSITKERIRKLGVDPELFKYRFMTLDDLTYYNP